MVGIFLALHSDVETEGLKVLPVRKYVDDIPLASTGV